MDYEKLERMGLKFIALLGINAIAFIFDHEYIPVALGADAIALGYELKPIAKKNE